MRALHIARKGQFHVSGKRVTSDVMKGTKCHFRGRNAQSQIFSKSFLTPDFSWLFFHLEKPKEEKTEKRGEDFWQLSFPRETAFLPLRRLPVSKDIAVSESTIRTQNKHGVKWTIQAECSMSKSLRTPSASIFWHLLRKGRVRFDWPRLIKCHRFLTVERLSWKRCWENYSDSNARN